jgi:putative flavoprotein involved in K+ transport
MWWLDRAGVLLETAEQVYDIGISRAEPSLQLVGRPDRATLDLPILQKLGVRIVGRMLSADRYRVRLADDLVATTAAADVKMAALLKRLDDFAIQNGMTGARERGEPFAPAWPAFIDAPAPLELPTADIRTVVWATGFRREYPWLKVPVLDSRGEIRHRGGVTAHPGLYAIGLYFLRRRNSSWIDGVGADAFALAGHIDEHLGRSRSAIA